MVPFIFEGFTEAKLFSFIIALRGEFLYMLTWGIDKLHDLPKGTTQNWSWRTA